MVVFSGQDNKPFGLIHNPHSLILSQKKLDGYDYVNLGSALAEALSGEDLQSKYLPMKAWDALKSIFQAGTVNGTLAIENFAIIFEPALKININAFLKEALFGRILVIKLEHKVSDDCHYYPFPEDHDYYMDFTCINTITR